LKILVLIKSVPDSRVPLECTEGTGRLMEGWNVSVLNPDDGAAVDQATGLRKRIAGTQVTVLHIGPASGERYIREALALGCDEGLRIRDDGPGYLHTAGKILILARVAEIKGFDLLITGARSQDSGSGQLGILLASALKVPCVTHVSAIDAVQSGRIQATRALEQGWREQVESSFPLVITTEASEDAPPCPSFADVARAEEIAIPCYELADIGISRDEIRRAESRLAFGPLSLPAPDLHYIQPPDSSLPAFERRRQISEGAMRRRQGRVVRGGEDEVVEELFRALLADGWLGHPRKATRKASDDSDPL